MNLVKKCNWPNCPKENIPSIWAAEILLANQPPRNTSIHYSQCIHPQLNASIPINGILILPSPWKAISLSYILSLQKKQWLYGAAKDCLLVKDTSLSSVIGTFKTLFETQAKDCLSFIAVLLRMENQEICTINTAEELLIDVSLALSIRVTLEWQNHLSQEAYPKMFLYS